MQDVQNIPNPDVNSIEDDGDFGSHSDNDSQNPNNDIEQPKSENPTPTDRMPNAPIEEPPTEEGESGETDRIV